MVTYISKGPPGAVRPTQDCCGVEVRPSVTTLFVPNPGTAFAASDGKRS